jgi:hypothetical protein
VLSLESEFLSVNVRFSVMVRVCELSSSFELWFLRVR